MEMDCTRFTHGLCAAQSELPNSEGGEDRAIERVSLGFRGVNPEARLGL